MGCGNSTEVKKCIFDFYDFGEQLGAGNYGQVLACEPRSKERIESSVEALAVKIVDLESTACRASEAFKAARDEFHIMGGLCHPHVVKLIEVFEDNRFLYVVMERIGGGELFQALRSGAEIAEEDVARVGFQLLEALEYLHEQCIVHRDIKAQNILLTQPPLIPGRALAEAEVKLIDFGLATRVGKVCFKSDRQLGVICGSPAMCAPEIWSTHESAPPHWKNLWGEMYGPKVDVWAAGVVLYLAMFGQLPYSEHDSTKLASKVCSPKTQPEFKSVHHNYQASASCRHCLSSMLEKDQSKRYCATKATQDPWLRQSSHRQVRGLRSFEKPIPVEVRRSAYLEAKAADIMRFPHFPAASKQELVDSLAAFHAAKNLHSLYSSDEDCSTGWESEEEEHHTCSGLGS